ncbi:hypothetical protein CC80DRAFT_362 [Byssothecium circinans]|uniref:DUF1772-domain-containing protein n=1 Tax=Byssothecium circinans TaxID=147558 RepID=A0A6A5UEA9_9PLEO|nr:hypothetical protein CC80DRAFT_362 [Byssothecium circinans]
MATTNVFGLTLTLSAPALTALRLAPLLSSTASLTHAYMEWLTTTAFLKSPRTDSKLTRSIIKSESTDAPPIRDNNNEVAAAKDIVIPIWYVNFFHTGLFSVIGLNSVTTYSALANVLLFPEGLGESKKIYMAGLAAAVAHYAFVPGVMWSVERLFRLCVKQQAKGEALGENEKGLAVESVREWVGVHKVRMATVDFGAWVCFAVAVVKVLTP